MGLFNGNPDTVNARGDKLPGAGGSVKDVIGLGESLNKLDPARRSELLSNWLTAGGPPKAIDPGVTFKERQDLAPVEAKAAAGQGFTGLFGIGQMIGDFNPKSPMQPNVPYSVGPIGKPGGG